MISIDNIKEQYPLHWLVWNNDYQELQELLLQTEQVTWQEIQIAYHHHIVSN